MSAIVQCCLLQAVDMHCWQLNKPEATMLKLLAGLIADLIPTGFTLRSVIMPQAVFLVPYILFSMYLYVKVLLI